MFCGLMALCVNTTLIISAYPAANWQPLYLIHEIKMSKINENDEVRRLKINERERRRMHDLNSAMDGLRGAMPYARGKS